VNWGRRLVATLSIARVPTLLVLGASVSQLATIRQARAAGFRVVTVDRDPGAVGFAEADVAEALDFGDVEAVVSVARRERVDGVVAISTDRAVPTAAAVAERLGLPGIGSEVARVMTNKAAMRSRLEECGVPQPRFAVASRGDAGVCLERIGLPAVLKPVDSGGQRGLFKLGSAGELTRLLPMALAYSRTGTVVLEQFVEGDELNVIAVVRGSAVSVLTLSDRLRPPGRGFGVGWIHLFPSELPEPVLAQARNVVVAAIEALGLRNGIAFPQLLATAEGDVLVVEVAARIAAGQMADLVRLGIGVDLTKIAFEQALGRPVPDQLVEAEFERPIAIRFFTASPGLLPTGEVVSVWGLDDVRASRNVLESGLYIEIGETIRPVQVDADRRGYVIATGTDQRDALAAANAAARKLTVITKAPIPPSEEAMPADTTFPL